MAASLKTLSRFAPRALIAVAIWSSPVTAAEFTPGPVLVPRAPQATDASASSVTAVSDCHAHETEIYCMVGTTEYLVQHTPSPTSDIPSEYTSCHTHDDKLFCLAPDGSDVEVAAEGAEASSEEDHDDDDDHEDHDDHDDHDDHEDHDDDAGASSSDSSSSSSESSQSGENCHFHAGVEHCEEDDAAAEGASTPSCGRTEREYNVPLRIGLLFVMLATSSIGVFSPIFLEKYLPTKLKFIFLFLKQFGTGIIISTAFIHLLTHAILLFGNECIGDLQYEAVAAAFLMAGLFISFLIEYLGKRFVYWQAAKTAAAVAEDGRPPLNLHDRTEMINITVLELGVLFHSILIGITLVVSGDSFFLTLFIVVVFHQFFEGIALGTRIAALGRTVASSANSSATAIDSRNEEAQAAAWSSSQNEGKPSVVSKTGMVAAPHTSTITLRKKLLLAGAFAFITPIGMAIGIGTLNQFNGNDPTTLWVLGILDSLSAGVLVWVGVVEMWAADWMDKKGELANASLPVTLLGMVGLVGGLVAMSVLGKWT